MFDNGTIVISHWAINPPAINNFIQDLPKGKPISWDCSSIKQNNSNFKTSNKDDTAHC